MELGSGRAVVSAPAGAVGRLIGNAEPSPDGFPEAVGRLVELGGLDLEKRSSSRRLTPDHRSPVSPFPARRELIRRTDAATISNSMRSTSILVR